MIRICNNLFRGLLFFFSVVWAKPFIALVLPFEHQAMNDIERGLRQFFPHDVKTFHAYGDTALLAQILQKVKHDKYDFIVSVGTATAQMTLSVFEKQEETTMICAAASLPASLLNAYQKRLYVIDDQILPDHMLKALQPYASKIAFLYSNTDKSFDDMKAARKAAHDCSITFEEKIIQQSQDIPVALRSVSSDVKALFIFKDHLLVSALPYLIQEAQKRKIPLIASDLSSVFQGATIAYGVAETQIGSLSGALIADLLAGKQVSQEISLAESAKFTYNMNSIEKQNIIPIMAIQTDFS